MSSIRRILVVEDNHDVLDAIVGILEYSGYPSKGLTELNEETCQQLQGEPPQLIILDVMLSGSDGRELARHIKNNHAIRHVPILMISAYPDVENSVREAGADDFLQKPFGLDELLNKVKQNIESISN